MRTLLAGRTRSLRWRLLAAVGVAVLMLWVLSGWFSYTQARREAEELMDGNLAQTGRMLMAIVRDNEGQLADLAARLATVRGAKDNIYEPPLEFQIGLGDGSILARSEDAPDLPVLGLAGYSDIIRRQGSWRVLNLISDDERYRVQVSHAIALREQAALEVAGHTVLPLAIIVPILVLLIYISIRSGLRPLEKLAAEVAVRSPENLAPLDKRHVPTESRPLVTAINRLFNRVGRTLENERRFTADAAHELRTPLAALKVQTQVARLSREAPMRDHALAQIEAGVDRASHLVDQLLRLARLDPLTRLPDAVPLDLGELAREAVRRVRNANPQAGQTLIEAYPDGGLLSHGDADLLAIAMRNLLDNAFRYSRPDSSIRVGLERDAEGWTLSVRDDGPGVSAAAQARLGERFYRARESQAEGSGLGLAIVARIAELHGARLQAGNHPDGGFIARLRGLPEVATEYLPPT